MRRERGTALLLVLWVTILLAALLVGVAAASRSHSEAALYGSEQIRAELAAEAGLAHAVAGLRAPDLAHQWVPDGRPYHFAFDGAKVTVAVVDIAGLTDLNAAAPALLRGVFEAAGVDTVRAGELATAIDDWRQQPTGGLRRGPTLPGQVMAGATSGQPGGPFRTLDELARVPGMDPALFAKLAGAVTVYSGRSYPDASYAGADVIAALRGIGLPAATALVEARRKQPAQRAAGNGVALGAVGNGALVAGYGGMVERVFSVATLPDGTHAGLDVSLRLALTGAQARPYKVLDWRTGSVQMP